MTDTKVVLVDVMSTLVTEPFTTTVPEFFGMSLPDLRRAVDSAAWIRFEKGLLTEMQFCDAFFLDGRGVDPNSLRQCLFDTYEWIDGMPSLMRELSAARYPIHALSNYPVWYEMIEQKLALSDFLQWTFVSCLTGLRKPEPSSYLQAAGQLGVDPGQCVFIDDRDENVQAARAVGMDGIQMTSSAQVRQELAARDMLGQPSGDSS